MPSAIATATYDAANRIATWGRTGFGYDLNGNLTGGGTIASTWKNPETGTQPAPIEAILVIRHKFDSISCILFTAESESQSKAAALQLEMEATEDS
jgi:hypothetical protein